MKISKKPTAVNAATAEGVAIQEPVVATEAIQSESRKQAADHIYAAITCLGKDAKTDIVARESIANLSVVLLDLK